MPQASAPRRQGVGRRPRSLHPRRPSRDRLGARWRRGSCCFADRRREAISYRGGRENCPAERGGAQISMIGARARPRRMLAPAGWRRWVLLGAVLDGGNSGRRSVLCRRRASWANSILYARRCRPNPPRRRVAQVKWARCALGAHLVMFAGRRRAGRSITGSRRLYRVPRQPRWSPSLPSVDHRLEKSVPALRDVVFGFDHGEVLVVGTTTSADGSRDCRYGQRRSGAAIDEDVRGRRARPGYRWTATGSSSASLRGADGDRRRRRVQRRRRRDQAFSEGSGAGWVIAKRRAAGAAPGFVHGPWAHRGQARSLTLHD